MDKYSQNVHRAFHEVFEALNRYKGFDVAYGDNDEDGGNMIIRYADGVPLLLSIENLYNEEGIKKSDGKSFDDIIFENRSVLRKRK